VLEDTDSADVVTASNENSRAVVKLDATIDGLGLKVELHSVVLVDLGVWEADGPAVVSDNIWDLVLAENLSLDLAKLELGFLSIDADGLETALGVVEDAEVLAGLVDGDDILEAEWVLGVSPDLVVNKDVGVLVFADLVGLLLAESILESLSKEDRNGNALTQFVGASRGACGVGS